MEYDENSQPSDSSHKKTAPLDERQLEALRAPGPRPVARERASLVIYSRDVVRAVPIVEGAGLIVGRFPPSDVTIPDESVSRRHAHIELRDGMIWIEDLNTTNGTWVNGERIKRCSVEADGEVSFGAVMASVLHLKPTDRRHLGVETHDRFQVELEAETFRAQQLKHSLALLMVQSDRMQVVPLGRWVPPLRKNLRPFDRLALYGPHTTEILMPETTVEEAVAQAKKLVERGNHLLCGVAVFPVHARSSDELVEVARTALQRASDDERLVIGPTQNVVAPGNGQGVAPCVVVESAILKRVFNTARRIASSIIPVLVVGETGTGKEMVARAIHEGGKRAANPFICVNCGAIPAQLIESTLFGYEKGAFTGASQKTKGVFESADNGTIFLDEIGELTAAAQAALLRVLESKRFCRVGSAEEIAVNVRVVAATNRSLEEMCAEKTFRPDLLYRLNGMKLVIPPLRERPEDILPLCEYFMHLANAANETQIVRIAPDAMNLILQYPWPGNARELRNAIERAVVVADGFEISVGDLPDHVRDLEGFAPQLIIEANEKQEAKRDCNPGATDLREEVHRYEGELIRKVLRETKWNRTDAACRLGISLRTLRNKIQAHDLRDRM